MEIGASCGINGTCGFTVWAPDRKNVELRIVSPAERLLPMRRGPKGFWNVSVAGLAPGTQYLYRLDGEIDRPDPASHYQPHGVHGPSEAVEHASFEWRDAGWKGVELPEMIIYELHVGTFTPEGTFDAIIQRTGELKDLGVNAIEIMPAGQFPGERNWGYDGAFPFAVQNSYGGPDALKRLVDACHLEGLAVILDVVYNHLGPEGNYLRDFGPYFTGKYRTPWGEAINFDDAFSDEVRHFFIQNALHWFLRYHIDALRLDAIHAMGDMSAAPFLRELVEETRILSEKTGRPFYLIAESDLNDARIIAPAERGGYGLDAQWCDDFHHALHTLLTGEGDGYYADFGGLDHLVKALREGFVYSGEYSFFRKRRHGNSSKDRPGSQFVVFSQNHDQTGNRMLGERLSALTDFEALKLCAGVVLLSPCIPLLFMGEEYAETAPFLYFTDHSDPNLIQAVRNGRNKEFESFSWGGESPDPQGPETFSRSKLDWEKRQEGKHKELLSFYTALIKLRREIAALRRPDKRGLRVLGYAERKVIAMYRQDARETSHVLCFFNFNEEDVHLDGSFFPLAGTWSRRLDSSDESWGGPGAASPKTLREGNSILLKGRCLVLYESQEVAPRAVPIRLTDVTS